MKYTEERRQKIAVASFDVDSFLTSHHDLPASLCSHITFDTWKRQREGKRWRRVESRIDFDSNKWFFYWNKSLWALLSTSTLKIILWLLNFYCFLAFFPSPFICLLFKCDGQSHEKRKRCCVEFGVQLQHELIHTYKSGYIYVIWRKQKNA